ncbi:hypothetical protein GIB67_012570 [Kingdonia uniflora]|uniref:Uncharacterized protein n=1 Tax=Kingdonia uniflora TaxID=39325 RepID=A0A7J7NF26_9MAGN|nr:hypothetical protein GIB67_012570 [Kingdonia uniflora]
MILSFELPFVLMPLLKFSSSQKKLGPHKSSIYCMLNTLPSLPEKGINWSDWT